MESKATDLNPGGGRPSAPTPPPTPTSPQNTFPVNLQRTASPLSLEVAFWSYIRARTNALSFRSYQDAADKIMCADPPGPVGANRGGTSNMRLPFPGVDRYTLLKTATEVYMMQNCGVSVADTLKITPAGLLEENARLAPNAVDGATLEQLWEDYTVPANDGGPQTLPYLQLVRLKLKDVPIKPNQGADNCFGILEEKLTRPCMIELIWSYWHEEAMLVQSMNALSLRFQNRRRGKDRDPLAHIEIDPLRPLSNILWGYIQDEQHRLGIERRAYEYDHHYGITMQGKAVPDIKGADSRSKFLGAFHNLLYLCAAFYKQDDDTTVVSDAFPVLNGLKETHIILTQGAHNQYGDLPWTARMEMLMEEWLLARPEVREFLPSRAMVAYPEGWMDRVEAMKRFQGWDDTPVVHYRDLGMFGEQILLSIRFHSWSEVFEPTAAKNWARYWRPEIQGYIHAYRAVTGVDLTAKPDATMPSVHIARRLGEQLRDALPRAAAKRLSSAG
jgi:hypothetical protein